MKKQLSRALLGLAASLFLAAAAFAQTAGAVVIQVPFDFVAGEKQMPAGRYTVRRVRSDAESALIIRSEDGRAATVVLTNARSGNPRRASLGFRQHGDLYFLAEVSMPGTATVRGLPPTGAERRAQRELIGQARSGDSKKVTIVGTVE